MHTVFSCLSTRGQRLVIVFILFMMVGLGCEVTIAPTISTMAGNNALGAGFGGDGSGATGAQLNNPTGVAVDAAGNLYIADSRNSVIRKVNAATQTITTVAGNNALGAGYGGDGGPATSAQLNTPMGVALDAAGNLYIADMNNNRVRRVDAATQTITTVAGNGNHGDSAGRGDGGPAISAQVRTPYGVVVDSAGNLYISDFANNINNNTIRKVDAATQTITTVAGVVGSKGYNGDGDPTTTLLDHPAGMAVDAAGNLYFADMYNDVVRVLCNTNSGVYCASATPGYIYTIAGTGQTAGYTGDGYMAPSAQLNYPASVVLDAAGNLYISDQSNNVIRKVDVATQTITTVAGNNSLGAGYTGDGNAAPSAQLNSPASVAVDASGNLFIADSANNVIRKVLSATVAAKFATTAVGSSAPVQNIFLTTNTSGEFSGISVAPSQGGVQEFVVGTSPDCVVGNSYSTGTVCTIPITFQPGYVGLRQASLVVQSNLPSPIGPIPFVYTFGLSGIGTGPQVALLPGLMTTVAGNHSLGAGYSGDIGPATSAQLTGPQGITLDGAGNLYVADTQNNVVRKVDAATQKITTVAGYNSLGPGYGGDGGSATSAQLNNPVGVAVDAAGNLYIADINNNVVRKVSANSVFPVGTAITTVAGNYSLGGGYGGDGGPATSAQLYNPAGLALDAAGNLYIADMNNNRVRRVDAVTQIITTVAGNGNHGDSAGRGDGGPAISAQVRTPYGVVVDSAGNLYISDFANNLNNNTIRKVDATTQIITTVAGVVGSKGYNGDGGLATSAYLNHPAGLAVDAAGSLYFADWSNSAVRKVDAATQIITTIAGTGTSGYSGDSGAATGATLSGPFSVALDVVGNLYIADAYNNVIREVSATAAPLSFATTNAGSQTTEQTVTLSNIGNAALTLTSAAPATANYVVDSSSPCRTASPLAAGASCALSLYFAPTAGGSLPDTLVFTDNALNVSGAAQSVGLSGTGVQTQQAQTINFPNPGTQTYGVSPITLTATATSGLAVAYSVTSGPAAMSAGKLMITGPGLVTVQATQDGDSNWTAAIPVSVTFTVNKAMPTATLQTSATAVLLQNSLTLTAKVTSTTTGTPMGSVTFMDGTASLGSTALDNTGTATLTLSTLAAGSHSITAVYGGDANFAGVTSAALTEAVQDFQLVVNGVSVNGTAGTLLSATVQPGGVATYQFQVAPVNGTTFPSAVTLSLSGLPAGATYSITPATLAAGSGAQIVTVQVQTARSIAGLRKPGVGSPLFALGLLLPMLGMVRLRNVMRSRAKRTALFLLLLLVIGMLGMSACGGSSGFFNQSPQTYTLHLNATSGTLQHSTILSLTIQ